MSNTTKIYQILTRPFVSSALVYRWYLILMSILTVYSWLTSFPIVTPLPYMDIAFSGIYLMAVIIGFIFVLRLNIPTMEIGWSVFGYAVLITFLNQFTDSPKFIGSILPGIFMSFSLIMIVVGLYFSYKRLEDELNKSKLAELYRLESEQKYRNLFEQSRDAIFISTRAGRFIEVNDSAINLLGYTKPELLTIDLHQLYTLPEKRQQYVKEMDSKGFVRDFELYLKKKDGRKILCLETAVTQRDDTNRIIGYYGTLRDITDQKKIENDLRISEERFRNISTLAHDAIIMMDPRVNISYWNNAAERIFGYKQEEVLGKDLHKLIVPERYHNQFKKGYIGFQKNGQGAAINKSLELVAIRHGGEEFPVELSLSSVKIEGEWNTIGIIRDITDRRKAEKELQDTNVALADSKMRAEMITREMEKIRDELQLALDSAKEADLMKSEFLANTSHELRTPLNSIIGFLKLVLDDLCDSPEEEREFLSNALQSSNLLLNLINDVLDIAKIEAGKMDIILESVNVKSLFKEIYTLTHVQTDQKKLFLKTSYSHDNLHILADSHKLRQILLNLVGNSVKFTSYGGIEIAADLVENKDRIKISVIDTGVGIAQGKHVQVFQKFTQADGSTSRKYGGTGLGLAITKSLVELMGGNISLSSEGAGKGTTMSFALPVFNEYNIDEFNKTRNSRN